MSTWGRRLCILAIVSVTACGDDKSSVPTENDEPVGEWTPEICDSGVDDDERRRRAAANRGVHSRGYDGCDDLSQWGPQASRDHESESDRSHGRRLGSSRHDGRASPVNTLTRTRPNLRLTKPKKPTPRGSSSTSPFSSTSIISRGFRRVLSCHICRGTSAESDVTEIVFDHTPTVLEKLKRYLAKLTREGTPDDPLVKGRLLR